MKGVPCATVDCFTRREFTTNAKAREAGSHRSWIGKGSFLRCHAIMRNGVPSCLCRIHFPYRGIHMIFEEVLRGTQESKRI